MNKHSIYTILGCIVALFLFGCEKKAEPIVLPPIEQISSIEIAGGIQDLIVTDVDVIASIVHKIDEAAPTSKPSVQDVPTVSEYIRIDFISDGNLSSVFLYEENSKLYVEQAYHGVFETDESFLKLIKRR